MCNCSKEVTETECQRIKFYVKDGRMFIYHIFDDERRLKIAFVPKDKTPLQVAEERGFYNENGELEFYHVKEHPCIKNDTN